MTAKFCPRPYTKRLAENYELLFDKYKRLWAYDRQSGLWKEETAEMILQKELRDHYMLSSVHEINEVIADLQDRFFRDGTLPEPPWRLIPFDNGVYDLETGDFRDFQQNDYFTSKLGVQYNRAATCSEIDRIFHDLVPPDNVIDLYELVAYSMIRAYPYQKLFFLYGCGANGKSVYANILEGMLGGHIVSHVSLQKLQSSRFSGAELYKKYLNICGELNYQQLERTELIKQLTGGDRISAERKFAQPFDFVNFGKLVFLTNELPPTSDMSNGFYRRIFTIEFPKVFDEKKADHFLVEHLGREEFEGLAFKCLGTAQQLMGTGFTFTNDRNTDKIREQYEALSNPLEAFIGDTYEADTEGAIPKQQFTREFGQWLKVKGMRPWSDTQLGKEMRKRNYPDGKRHVGGGRQNCWLGLKSKQDKESVQPVQSGKGGIIKIPENF